MSLDDYLQQLTQLHQLQLVYESRLTQGKSVTATQLKLMLEQVAFQKPLSQILQQHNLTFKLLNNGTLIIVEAKQSSANLAVTQVKKRSSKHKLPMEKIVVTGINLANKFSLFQTAYPVSVISESDTELQQSSSAAEVLAKVPGLYLERSAGTVGNNAYTRGLPNDNFRYVRMLEDGLPSFEEGAGAFTNADIFIRMDKSIARIEAVKGGSGSIVASNAAGATVNIVNKKSTDVAEGEFVWTTTDFGLQRLDVFAALPITDAVSAHAAGYWSNGQTVRELPFNLPAGGQVKFGITYVDELADVHFNFKRIHDHNVFYPAVPMRNQAQGFANLNPIKSSYMSADMAELKLFDGQGQRKSVSNLEQGVESSLSSYTFLTTLRLSPNWQLDNKLRYVTGSIDFSAAFSGGARLADLSSELADIQADYTQVDSFRFAYLAEPQQLVSLQQLPNQLLNDVGIWRSQVDLNNWINDINLNYLWHGENDLSHSLTLGYYHSQFQQTQLWNWQSVVTEVVDSARLIDIFAVDKNGQVVVPYTDKGVWKHHANLAEFADDVTYSAWYLVDNIQLSDTLRLDLGYRYQSVDKKGFVRPTEQKNLRTDETDAWILQQVSVFQPKVEPYVYAADARAWTLGLNYDWSEQLAFFARYSSTFRITAEFAQWFDCCQPIEKNISLIELGSKLNQGKLSAFVTLFANDFPEIAISNQIIDEETQQVVIESANAGSKAHGVEWDLYWQALPWLDFTFSGFVQSLKYSRFDSVQGDYRGKQIVRQPNYRLNLQNKYYWSQNQHFIYVAAELVGRRYQDAANTLVLPAYAIWSLGGAFQLNEDWSLNWVINNLTNELALTEGSPRASQVLAHQTDYFVGRAIDGRNSHISIKYRFW